MQPIVKTQPGGCRLPFGKARRWSVWLSESAEKQLNQLKRRTKIKQWNILCRWAHAGACRQRFALAKPSRACRSLAEKSAPSPVPIARWSSRWSGSTSQREGGELQFATREARRGSPEPDSKVEIAWKVFGGEMADVLAIAVAQRCHQDELGTEPNTLKEQALESLAVARQRRHAPACNLHLHRGIGYLAGDTGIKSIEDLVGLVNGKE